MRSLWRKANWPKVREAIVGVASSAWTRVRAGWTIVRKLCAASVSRWARLRTGWPAARKRLVTSAGGACAGLRTYLGDPEDQVMWGIVLLAAVLRLAHLDLIPFRAEQARQLLRGLRVVDRLLPPLVGAKSVDGIVEPPGMTLLLALPLLLGRDPRIASAFLSLLNVAAVLGCYRLARRHLGLIPAIVSASLFAVNPWAVFVSRQITTASVLPPLSVLLLHGLYAGIVDRRPWGWVLACATLGLMLNVTLSCLPLILVLALLVDVHSRRVCWRGVLLGLSLAAISFMPYTYYEYGHGFRDLGSLLEALAQGPGVIVSAFRAIRWAGWIHSGHDLRSLAGVSASHYLPAPAPLAILDRLAAWAFLASLVGVLILAVRAWSHWKERRDPAGYLIVAVWLWVPLLVASSRAVQLAPHSLVILYPVGFLAIGLVLGRTMGYFAAHKSWRFWRPVLQITAWLAMLLVVTWQTYSVVYLRNFVARYDTTGGFGAPYRFWRCTADLVRRQVSAAGTDQVSVVARGSDIGHDEQPLLLHYLLEPEIRTRFLGHGGAESLLLPAVQPAVYLLMRESPPVESTIDRLDGEDRGLVIFPGGELRARVKVAGSRPAKEILGLIDNRTFQVLDSGACLLGYDWPPDASPGQAVTFASYWTFIDIPAQETRLRHSLFNHLHASSGPLVAQCYGLGLLERDWSPGLVLVQWFEMPLPADLPPGDYALLTGMYRLSDLSRNRCIDDLGRDTGDAIKLGPLTVTGSRARAVR